MSDLNEEYSKILSEIENKISNLDERKFVLKKVQDLSSLYMGLVDRITKLDDSRFEKIEKKQEKMTEVVSKIEDSVNLIKSDIYEDKNYDFEIVCPYCNHEFVADIESELREEIECPECHNTIKLDWDEDEENCPFHSQCDGTSCESCHEENNDKKDNNQNNDDDM